LPRRSGAKAGAFSLVELMLVVGLLSLIVLALMAVFNSAQTAFRASITQTDVLEGGRATMDMMAADLRQMAPSYGASNGPANFCVTNYPVYPLLLQSLVGSGYQRTNLLENFFILSRNNINGNDSWIGTGYAVVANPPQGLYSLYRFTAHYPVMAYGPDFVFTNALTNTFANFLLFPTNYSHLLDGVVDLRLLAYDTNGMLIRFDQKNVTTNALFYAGQQLQANGVFAGVGWLFYSNALPASVDIELGVLEDRVLQRAATWPNGSQMQNAFLKLQAGKVHLFRQRVTIPNVDPSAYQ
jgi:type II secretory pathway pseudopilin PulG